MGDSILGFLGGLASWVPEVLGWVSLVIVVLAKVIRRTPWQEDDKVLDMILKLPVLGEILVALIAYENKPKA